MSILRISRFNAGSLFAVIILVCLSACATVPKPVASVKPGNEIETLQSPVALSVKAGGKSIGGRGYLVFKRPDRFHLAVLSPFGTTLMDVFVSDDRMTCLVPSKQTAYQGRISQLPDRNALRGWGMMRWVVDTPPAPEGTGAGTREYRAADGRTDFLTYDDRGLLIGKSNEGGDRVVYGEYHDLNGVAFPSSIEMSNNQGDMVRIVFDEPEINKPLEEAALNPQLEGVDVLPLTEFKGL
jgi:hypothetical protein